MKTRVCNKCGNELPETHEYFKKTPSKNGMSLTCKKCTEIKSKEYRTKNKEKISKKKAEYNKKNAEKIAEYNKKYQEKNKHELSKKSKEYREKNKDHFLEEKRRRYATYDKEKRNEGLRKKYNADIEYKLSVLCSSRIKAAIGKNEQYGNCKELLGCDIAELKIYLESKFKKGMTWDNYNIKGWHIDHIMPCAAFDFSKEEDQRKCFHYTNMQPLWASENHHKSGKYNGVDYIKRKTLVRDEHGCYVKNAK